MDRKPKALLALVIVAAATVVAALASAAEPRNGLTVPPPLVGQMEVLTEEGISPARALDALELQDEVADTQLLTRVEAALGRRYAGAWFEPEEARLHIGVTSAKDRRAVEDAVAEAGVQGIVAVTPVHSTWSELQAARDRWNEKLADLFASGQVSTGLNAERNAVSVWIASSVAPRRRAALEQEARAERADVVVSVEPADRLRITAQGKETVCKEWAENKAFCDKPLTAGVRIEGAEAEICTAGPLAIPIADRSETYVLTAGHCIKGAGAGSSWIALPKEGEEKYIGKAGTFVFNTTGDFGKIKVEPAGKIEPSGYWLTGEEKRPAYAVTARWSKKEGKSYPVVGQQVPTVGATTCHQGQTTGEKCGKIEATEVLVGVNHKGEEVEVDELVKTTAVAAGGDSGGPYMGITAEGKIYIEGTHVAGNAAFSYFEPISTSLKELGLELLTTDNELRTFGNFKKKKEGVTTITGVQPETPTSTFGFGAHGVAICGKAHFQASTAATGLSQETLTVTPKYELCTFKGVPGTVVETNGCDYLLNAKNSQFAITCPAGKSLTFKVFNAGILKCTIGIPTQTVGGATYANLGGTNGITLTLNLPGLKYTTTAGMGAGACAPTPTASNGSYFGDITLKGTTGGVAEEIFIG